LNTFPELIPSKEGRIEKYVTFIRLSSDFDITKSVHAQNLFYIPRLGKFRRGNQRRNPYPPPPPTDPGKKCSSG